MGSMDKHNVDDSSLLTALMAYQRVNADIASQLAELKEANALLQKSASGYVDENRALRKVYGAVLEYTAAVESGSSSEVYKNLLDASQAAEAHVQLVRRDG